MIIIEPLFRTIRYVYAGVILLKDEVDEREAQSAACMTADDHGVHVGKQRRPRAPPGTLSVLPNADIAAQHITDPPPKPLLLKMRSSFRKSCQ